MTRRISLEERNQERFNIKRKICFDLLKKIKAFSTSCRWFLDKKKCPPNQDIEKHWAQKFVEFLYRGGRYCYGQVELLYGQLGLSSSSPSVAFPASLNLTSIQQNLYLSGRFLSYPSSSALASALLFWSLRFPWEFSNQSTRAFGTTFCTFIARGIFAISKKTYIVNDFH